ncbi:MAG TPA: hypothetical protein VF432_32625 [Thermoanaerobaculia bacterium]
MNLTAATVTVYFIGVVNFYDPRTTEVTREVVVPLASSATSVYATLPLKPHVAQLIVTGIDGTDPQKDCQDKLGGQWSADTCTVAPVSGRKITLPASTETLDTSGFSGVPNLRTLCKTMGGIKRRYLDTAASYAARLTLKTGTLGVCSKDKAWVAKLILTDPTGELSLNGDGNGVKLKDKAVVQIANLTSVGGSELSHFSWHYKMYDTPVQCSALPQSPTAQNADPCPDDIVHFHGLVSASGVGCSPTQYP